VNETTTRGKVKIVVDESIKPLIEAEIFAFESLYPDAVIIADYNGQEICFDRFMHNDSVRLIFSTRKLTQNETDILKSKNIIPRTTLVAKDAVVFIINKSNNDSTIKYEDIKRILNGECKKWNDIDPKNMNQDIVVVFDNKISSSSLYLKNKLMIDKFSDNCYGVNTNEEVVNYVKKHKNSLGVIGLNWISDKFDSLSNKFLSEITVCGISLPGGDNAEQIIYRKPYQAYLATGDYPFVREIYVISRESFSGLGSGFASFVAGDIGQRIILKNGLLPATMPLRLISIKND